MPQGNWPLVMFATFLKEVYSLHLFLYGLNSVVQVHELVQWSIGNIGYYITFKAHLRKKASNQEGLFLSTYPWCRLQRWGSGTSSCPLKAAELTILFLHAFVCIRVHLRLFVSLHCVSWNDSGSLHVGKRLDFLYCKHEREQWFCWTSQRN